MIIGICAVFNYNEVIAEAVHLGKVQHSLISGSLFTASRMLLRPVLRILRGTPMFRSHHAGCLPHRMRLRRSRLRGRRRRAYMGEAFVTKSEGIEVHPQSEACLWYHSVDNCQGCFMNVVYGISALSRR